MCNNFLTIFGSKLKIEKKEAYFPKPVKNGSSKTKWLLLQVTLPLRKAIFLLVSCSMKKNI